MNICTKKYFLALTISTVLVLASCYTKNSFFCVWQSPLDYAYYILTKPSRHIEKVEICGTTYKNKDNGQLFQDIRRLTLNCDSTFTWKHVSCLRRDTSFGSWTKQNNILYLKTSDKLKKKIAKQNKQDLGELFGDCIDLTNTSLTYNDTSIIWQHSTKWTDTLYRN
jgi:hypothetical protein